MFGFKKKVTREDYEKAKKTISEYESAQNTLAVDDLFREYDQVSLAMSKASYMLCRKTPAIYIYQKSNKKYVVSPVKLPHASPVQVLSEPTDNKSEYSNVCHECKSPSLFCASCTDYSNFRRDNIDEKQDNVQTQGK